MCSETKICKQDNGSANLVTFVYLQEQVARLVETETSSFTQFMLWAWSGSRYSGLLCMALSSSIYCIMEFVADVFSG